MFAAEAQLRAARAAVSGARSSLFPTLSTSPSAIRSNGVSRYTIPLDAVYQLDSLGQHPAKCDGGFRHRPVTAAQLEVARLLYQAELATDYFELQGLDASRRLFEGTVKSYERSFQITKDRFDGGVASEGDMALAQTQLETARLTLADLGVQRALFEHAIAVLTGKLPSALSMPDGSLQTPPPESIIGLPSTLLQRRPDIAAAERQVAAANEQIGIAKAALYPSLTLSASAGSESTAILDLLTWPSRFWSIGPQLAQTLFDAGRRRAQVRVTEATYDATVANYRQTVLTAFQQVEDHLAELRILAEEAVIADRAVAASQHSLTISNTQYTGGLTNYLTVITAQTAALQNQRSAVDILTQRLVASVALVEALGGGWNTLQLPSNQALRSN